MEEGDSLTISKYNASQLKRDFGDIGWETAFR